jgi:hypothetical protein
MIIYIHIPLLHNAAGTIVMPLQFLFQPNRTAVAFTDFFAARPPLMRVLPPEAP